MLKQIVYVSVKAWLKLIELFTFVDSFCGAYSVPTSAEIYSAIPSREITVSFAREANGLNITLPPA
jgi:hypothetical protein